MTGITTRRKILSLGVANLYNALLQFALPIMLVRFLDVNDFGYYKLFWLITSTVMMFAPMGVPRSLLYFLPRLSEHEISRFVTQTFIFLLSSGLLGAFLVSPLNPFVPSKLDALVGDSYIPATFVLIWVVASLIEILPSADQRINWQAWLVVFLASIRVASVSLVAWYTGDVMMVFRVLVLFAALKLLMLVFYIGRFHTVSGGRVSLSSYREQLSHAIPFGLTGMLNKMRPIAEQWVVALMFAPAAFGAFALAVAMMPLLNMLKQSVGFVTLPKMSLLQSQGEIEAVLKLNNKGNVVVAVVMFPVVAFLMLYARYFVVTIYTQDYAAAAPVIQVYALATLILSIEISSILIVFRQGNYVAIVSSSLILIAVVCSYLGSRYIGLTGGAFGTLVTVVAAATLYFRRASSLTNVPIVQIQQWDVLIKIAISALFASILSYNIVGHFSEVIEGVALLITGGLIHMVLYILGILLMQQGWLLKTILGKSSWRDRPIG